MPAMAQHGVTMVTFNEALRKSMSNMLCAASSSGQPFRDWFSQATSGITGLEDVADFAQDAGDLGTRLFCDSDDGGAGGGTLNFPPAAPPPGQCECEGYVVTVSYDAQNGQRITTPIDALYGPIGGIFQVIESGRLRVKVPCRGIFPLVCEPNIINFTVYDVSANDQQEANPAIDSITPKPGFVDDCGVAPPQEPPVWNDTLDYDDPTGQPVQEPIIIAPRFPIVLPDGGFSLPANIQLGLLNFDIDFNLNLGGISFNFGGGAGASPCCPDVEVPDEEVPEEPEDPEEPETNERLWGIKTTTTVDLSQGTFTEIGDGNTPNLYIPRLGVVRFAIQIGGVRGWTHDIPIKTLSQVIEVPGSAVAYDFTIFPEKGATIDVNKIIIEVPEGE